MILSESICMTTHGDGVLCSLSMAMSIAYSLQEVVTVDGEGWNIVVLPLMTAHPEELCILDASV